MQIKVGRRLRLNISLDFKYWNRKLNKQIKEQRKLGRDMIHIVRYIKDRTGLTVRESLEYAKRILPTD